MGLYNTCLKLIAPANKKVQANCILKWAWELPSRVARWMASPINF